jgi:hypothetical protein
MLPTDNSLLIFVCAVILCGIGYSIRSKTRPKIWFPPGPAGWPIVGNLPAILSGHWYVTFSAWQKEYGKYPFSSIHAANPLNIPSYRRCRLCAHRRKTCLYRKLA